MLSTPPAPFARSTSEDRFARDRTEAARHLESARMSAVVAFLEAEPTPHAVAVTERLASNVAADLLQAGSPSFGS